MKNELLKLVKAICVSFIGAKGGCLKTTCCQNLSVSFANKGFKVIVVDTDPQKTHYLWWVIRENKVKAKQEKLKEALAELKAQEEKNGVENKIVRKRILAQMKKLELMKNLVVVSRNPSELDWSEIEAFKSQYDVVLFDTSGHLEFIDTTKTLIKKSDFVFIPFNNSIDDFNTRFDMKKTIDNCKAEQSKIAQVYSVVVDMSKKQADKAIAGQFFNKLSDSMPLVPFKLYKRSSWLDVKYSGSGVVESGKDKIAAEQFNEFSQFIINKVASVQEAA